MSNDDLLRMLDLEGKEAPPPNEPLPITPAGEGKRAAPASPTVLRLDDWGLRRGADVLRESERLQQCLAGMHGWEEKARAVADFHGAAFEVDPQLNDPPTGTIAGSRTRLNQPGRLRRIPPRCPAAIRPGSGPVARPPTRPFRHRSAYQRRFSR